MKKEILSTSILFLAALLAAFILDVLGGYSIVVIWIWEVFVLLVAQVLAIKRTLLHNISIKAGVLIDIGILIALMFGYLSNFRNAEKFPYPDSHIIISRLLIIIIYYLLCRWFGCYKRGAFKVAICILVEWISIYAIVFKGGTKFEAIIDNTDNYVKAISGDWIMNAVSYYCMPGEKLFWNVSCCLIIFIIILIWITNRMYDREYKKQFR